jgi:hypothetical protein
MRKKPTISPDQLDLFQLAEASHELEQRKKMLEDSRRRMEVERSHYENTLPPSDVVSTIEKRKRIDMAVSRNDLRNIRQEQRSSTLLLALLIALTAAFIWLGFTLMQEG